MMNALDLIARSAPLFLKGAVMTVQVLLMAGSFSLSLGLFFGLITCQRLYVRFLSPLFEGICFVARGVPFFVQLLIVYFVIPDFFGCNLGPLPASVIALGFCSSGYVAQFVRGALNGLPVAQWEAAYALGYGTRQTLWRIILPQTFRLILPTLNNELDALLKSTALVSSIGLLELTRVGMNLVSREMEPIPIYLTLALFYLCLSAAINLITKKLERKFAYVKY